MSDRAFILPGLGYGPDRPLLYYTRKLLEARGYAVQTVCYGPLPPFAAGDPQSVRAVCDAATAYAERALAGTEAATGGQVLFVGKSIGSVAAARLAARSPVNAAAVLFTPLEAACETVVGRAVAFTGSSDPLAATPALAALCEERSIPLHISTDANHSLETGDVDRDIETLRAVLDAVRAFVDGLHA